MIEFLRLKRISKKLDDRKNYPRSHEHLKWEFEDSGADKPSLQTIGRGRGYDRSISLLQISR